MVKGETCSLGTRMRAAATIAAGGCSSVARPLHIVAPLEGSWDLRQLSLCVLLQMPRSQVDPRPQGPSQGVHLRIVGRIAWAAALCGATSVATPAAARAAAARELAARTWADLARAHLAVEEARLPERAPPRGAVGGLGHLAVGGAGNGAHKGGHACMQRMLRGARRLRPRPSAGCPPHSRRARRFRAAGGDAGDVSRAVAARAAVLEVLEDAIAAFARLRDADGLHYAAKLAWNTSALGDETGLIKLVDAIGGERPERLPALHVTTLV